MNPPNYKRITISDLILIVGILSFSLASFFIIIIRNPPGNEIMIESIDGVISRPLKTTERLSIKGPLGMSLIEIKNGKVRMVHSPCPTKICEHTGWIRKEGESIVCIPNHIVIRIRGNRRDKYDTITK